MKTELLIVTSIMVMVAFMVFSTLFSKREERAGEGYLLAKYAKKTEKQIYDEKSRNTKEELIEEMKMYDVCLKKSEKIGISTAFTRALFSKSEEFREEEILNLLEASKTYDMLDVALVDIYFCKDYDRQSLKSLFYDSAMSVGAKEKILNNCEFSKKELERICYVYDNSFSVIAMKKLIDMDLFKAFDISKTIMFQEDYLNNSNKLYIAALGICSFYKYHSLSDLDQAAISERVREILRLRSHLKSDLARTQLICVLANNNDFDDFRYLVSSNDIEQELKASLIEKNVDLILEKIKQGANKDELDCILLSMSIYPVKEVGEKLDCCLRTAA